MKKQIITIILITLALPFLAQNDCPNDYSKKNVKCNGVIIQKCVPNNTICKDCWAVKSYRTNNKTSVGLWWYDSYEKAKEAGERDTKKASLNNGMETEYTIYLDDSRFCGSDNKVKYTKFTSVDGMLIEVSTDNTELTEPQKEMISRTRKLILDTAKVNDGKFRIKTNTDATGVRGENTLPKVEVESMAITEEQPVKKTTPKKK